VIVENVKRDEDTWMIIGTYAKQNLGEVLQEVEDWIEEKESRLNKIMGGDFNARTGKMGAEMELDNEGKEEKTEWKEKKKVER